MEIYTSIEQENELLQAGVPADTADCYYGKDGIIHDKESMPTSLIQSMGLPLCWSIGNIQQIYDICYVGENTDKYDKMFADNVIELFVADCKNNMLDFSLIGNE